MAGLLQDVELYRVDAIALYGAVRGAVERLRSDGNVHVTRFHCEAPPLPHKCTRECRRLSLGDLSLSVCLSSGIIHACRADTCQYKIRGDAGGGGAVCGITGVCLEDPDMDASAQIFKGDASIRMRDVELALGGGGGGGEGETGEQQAEDESALQLLRQQDRSIHSGERGASSSPSSSSSPSLVARRGDGAATGADGTGVALRLVLEGEAAYTAPGGLARTESEAGIVRGEYLAAASRAFERMMGVDWERRRQIACNEVDRQLKSDVSSALKERGMRALTLGRVAIPVVTRFASSVDRFVATERGEREALVDRLRDRLLDESARLWCRLRKYFDAVHCKCATVSRSHSARDKAKHQGDVDRVRHPLALPPNKRRKTDNPSPQAGKPADDADEEGDAADAFPDRRSIRSARKVVSEVAFFPVICACRGLATERGDDGFTGPRVMRTEVLAEYSSDFHLLAFLSERNTLFAETKISIGERGSARYLLPPIDDLHRIMPHTFDLRAYGFGVYPWHTTVRSMRRMVSILALSGIEPI